MGSSKRHARRRHQDKVQRKRRTQAPEPGPTSTRRVVLSRTPATKPSSSRSSEGGDCSLCGKHTSRPKHHFRREHLPFFLYPDTMCGVCQKQLSWYPALRHHASKAHPESELEAKFNHEWWADRVSSFLVWLALRFGMVSPLGLVHMVERSDVAPPLATEDVDHLAVIFVNSQANYGWELTVSQVAMLLGWRSLRHLLQLLPEELRSLDSLMPPEDMFCLEPAKMRNVEWVFDAHFRWDQIDAIEVTKLPHFLGTLQVAHRGITSYCHPEHWPALMKEGFPQDESIHYAFGVHPSSVETHAATPGLMEQLRHFVSLERVLAVGEVGLDYLNHQAELSRSRQRWMLAAVLRLAREVTKPVVIRYRGTREAFEDCRRIMREELSHLHPVHFLQFSGTPEELGEWRHAFPNSVFGFGPHNLDSLVSLAEHSPLAHSVLESDAPDALDQSWTFCSRNEMVEAARKLAKCHKCTEGHVFRRTAATALRFYRVEVPVTLR